MALPTDLRTNVVPGDPAHAKLHNDANKAINALDDKIDQVDDAVADATTAKTAAQAARAAAEAAAAQATDISNIDTPDSLVKTLVANPASQTAVALSASYVGRPYPSTLAPADYALEGFYDHPRYLYNWTSGSLRHYRRKAAMARLGTDRCRIQILGDSNGLGVGSSNRVTNSWAARLVSKMSARGNPLGGYLLHPDSPEYDSRWTRSGAVSSLNGLMWAIDSGGSATIHAPGNWTELQIAYLNYYAGSFEVRIAPTLGGLDTAGAYTVTRTPGGTFALWNVGPLNDGSFGDAERWVRITGAPSLHLARVDFLRPSGFVYEKATISGATASTFASINGYDPGAVARYGFPDLTLLALGTNSAPGSHYAQMQQVIEHQAGIGSDVLLINPPSAGGVDMSQIWEDGYRLSDHYGIPLLDFGDRIGPYATAGMFADGDDRHLNDAGHDDFAEMVASVIAA